MAAAPAAPMLLPLASTTVLPAAGVPLGVPVGETDCCKARMAAATDGDRAAMAAANTRATSGLRPMCALRSARMARPSRSTTCIASRTERSSTPSLRSLPTSSCSLVASSCSLAMCAFCSPTWARSAALSAASSAMRCSTVSRRARIASPSLAISALSAAIVSARDRSVATASASCA